MNGARPARPPAIVVGGGIVGICCALQLRRDGAGVVLIDRAEPGAACSYGNAGLLATGGVAPEALPGIVRSVPRMLLDREGPLSMRWRDAPRLVPWLTRFALSSRPAEVERISRALASLAARVLSAYEPLLEAAGARHLVRREGWLHLFESDAAFEGAAAAIELRRRRGVPVDIIPAEELRQMEPALAPIFARGAFLRDFAHAVDPKLISEALLRLFVDEGGRVMREEVHGFVSADGRISAVRTAGAGVLAASSVVLAAGAWSKPLAAELGVRAPLAAERGYHVMLPAPGVEIRRPLMSAEGGFALTPMAGGLRIAGTVELASIDAPFDRKRPAAMLRRAQRMLPLLTQHGAVEWVGARPSLPDSLPVIGRSPKYRNAFLAFGHGHRGLSFAAITGRIVADLAADRPPALDISPYSPTRFMRLAA